MAVRLPELGRADWSFVMRVRLNALMLRVLLIRLGTRGVE